jgi:ABC-2 type transport system permease protein
MIAGALGALRAQLAKWSETVRICWSTQLAYKLNLLLLVIGPMVVFFFIRQSLWRAIFAVAGTTQVQGYDLPAMLRYQGWVLVVSLIAQGQSNMQISEDIRLGRISAFLVYPFQFWQYHAASFLAFEGLQTLVAGATTLVLLVAGILPGLQLVPLIQGLLFAWLVGCVWFTAQFILGLASFWLEETWVLRVMFGIIAQFLSGATLPLEVFPAWLVHGLSYSPFPYLTWAPVRILMGEYPGEVSHAFLVLGGWFAGFALIAAVVWRRGLRLYSAAGM